MIRTRLVIDSGDLPEPYICMLMGGGARRFIANQSSNIPLAGRSAGVDGVVTMGRKQR